MLEGNVLYGQSGGPSSAINASALGVILEAMEHKDVIHKIYMMHHGIVGAINDDIIDVTDEDVAELKKLRHTSGAYFGNVRYKLLDWKDSEKDYRKILKTLKKYNIRYFFYNGGNDSMDTCNKISTYLQKVGYECRVMGIPKTIDNDLPITDHTPGYGTSAKFIANSMIDIDLDNASYPQGRVIVVEIMGRHAGWLAASSALANLQGHGPDLIYVPEIPFEMDKFYADVDKVYQKKKRCLVAVSEGIVDKNGSFIFQVGKKVDAFGHLRLGGVCQVLSTNVADALGVNSVALELSFLQRGACRIASKVDIEEGEGVGREAVKRAIEGVSDKMIAITRLSSKPYKIEYTLADLSAVANYENKLPRDMINEEGNNVTEKFIEYAAPLIVGELDDTFTNGLIDVPHLKNYRPL